MFQDNFLYFYPKYTNKCWRNHEVFVYDQLADESIYLSPIKVWATDF
jgi:hypothetical protein